MSGESKVVILGIHAQIIYIKIHILLLGEHELILWPKIFHYVDSSPRCMEIAILLMTT